MATISDLIGLLSPILGLHASTLVRHASQLRVGGFLPHEDENLAAGEAAVFLAAATGARAPTESVEAARVFTALPLIKVEDYREDPGHRRHGRNAKGDRLDGDRQAAGPPGDGRPLPGQREAFLRGRP